VRSPIIRISTHLVDVYVTGFGSYDRVSDERTSYHVRRPSVPSVGRSGSGSGPYERRTYVRYVRTGTVRYVPVPYAATYDDDDRPTDDDDRPTYDH